MLESYINADTRYFPMPNIQYLIRTSILQLNDIDLIWKFAKKFGDHVKSLTFIGMSNKR